VLSDVRSIIAEQLGTDLDKVQAPCSSLLNPSSSKRANIHHLLYFPLCRSLLAPSSWTWALTPWTP
jgi:hypothetical protein